MMFGNSFAQNCADVFEIVQKSDEVTGIILLLRRVDYSFSAVAGDKFLYDSLGA